MTGNGTKGVGEKAASVALGRVVATERRPNTAHEFHFWTALDSPAGIGATVPPERPPNPPHEFHFWTALDSPVGIGTIVRVDGAHPIDGQLPHIYGVVTDGLSYTDLQSPLYDVIGADGEPDRGGAAPTQRPEIRLYTAAVLRQFP